MLAHVENDCLGKDLVSVLEATRKRLGAERVLITDVGPDTQFVVAHAGAPLPDAFRISVPLTHSICQHVVGMRFPLVIEDAAAHPLLIGSRAVSDLKVAAYLGQPFGSEFPSTAMCALSSATRGWSLADRGTLNAAIEWITQRLADELAQRLDDVRRIAAPENPLVSPAARQPLR